MGCERINADGGQLPIRRSSDHISGGAGCEATSGGIIKIWLQVKQQFAVRASNHLPPMDRLISPGFHIGISQQSIATKVFSDLSHQQLVDCIIGWVTPLMAPREGLRRADRCRKTEKHAVAKRSSVDLGEAFIYSRRWMKRI
ncbi:hypothetical protein HW509_08650 [Asaia spathodeae]|uniref:hypothetical protein n=1 Tax=Asaia spathodeae TaxID=657016 RepID=UPI002FC2CDB7